MSRFDGALRAAFGDARVVRDAPLAPITTFKVGGPADWLVTLREAEEIRLAIWIAREHGLPVSLVGGGSNLLVADAGVRGLVIRVHGGDVRLVDDTAVRADAGVTINGLVRWTVTRGIAGVEAWAGTPGTVGGAIFGNAHFQGRLISELISEVALISRDGVPATVRAMDMEFGYDYSRLHRTGEIVVSADFHARPGDPDVLRRTARESLAFRKATQPLEKASAGCIFQNPDPARDCLPPGFPASAGALVDRAGLKGAAEGGARVSARHANFIVNDGTATAADVAKLIERCRREVHDRFGVELRDEIVRLGSAASEPTPKGPHVDSQG
ncbi:MAG TPA: UDP-N-acetylmuramate dehydrogenase [Vicinamibacterales bacterium]|nr:UDP-N-acetylmuramate dehydrogenase [Vicinamibacterales bacterium]